MQWVELELERNEASDLLPLESRAVLDAHGWDLGYYAVLDEGRLDGAVVVLGHAAGAALHEGWCDHTLTLVPDVAPNKTDDAEAAARHDGWVYVFGSHYGKKAGPVHIRRQWQARFREDVLSGHLDDTEVPVWVWRDRFLVHRLVNDALAASEVGVADVPPALADNFIDAGRSRAESSGKDWADRLRPGDHPLNIEGAAFRPDGNLLLGLRWPVAADGSPLLVELRGVPQAFAGREDVVEAVAVWRLLGPERRYPVGVRAMSARGADCYDVVVGSLDAPGKGSVLLESRPDGEHAHSRHWRFELDQRTGGGDVNATEVYGFTELTRIEGLSPAPDGHTVYVVDEDSRIHVRFLAEA